MKLTKKRKLQNNFNINLDLRDKNARMEDIMSKENLSFLVCCANGAGSSLMMKMAMQKVLDKVGLKPTKVHHCALSEGKSAASQYDVVFCAQNFTNMFKDAEAKGTKVIGLRNIMSTQEIEEKMKENGLI
jgi:PTS system ascorbate-specific IIB component